MTNSIKTILPPATIGILGGGQLGQMMALAAKSMGYKVGILDPTKDAPAAQVSDFQIVADYDDQAALQELAQRADVLTYEFENVDQAALAKVTNLVDVPQAIDELTITSHRLHEKNFLKEHHIPVTNFAAVNTAADLKRAVSEIGFPGILKTCEGGYDGHDQIDINNQSDVEKAAGELNDREWIFEQKQPFVKEVSIMVTRDVTGKKIPFPLSENIHQHHILHTSIVPARVSTTVHEQASQIATKIADRLELVGVLGIEFFLMEDGTLLVNELAPRPHNSGHYSIEACNISQFEAHIRSICGLAIPTIEQDHPAVMVNLLGDNLTVARQALPTHPEWHFHDYGKAEIRPGRKMGHVTVVGDSIAKLLEQVNQFK
ncbi:5-(carboxyamino)imidazole ribonucleotide synthase [Nicoliella spurrieriana]|uniref:N5-carboxyaminoimidazole ribonucleotide synthase n=1 Tax=Nicoliella spurrieriana TaxID=2925830 RepID=A0A976RRW4_9LACO|nr:5-(carboxyamino)imidazole ribonucleotide synthase [Nicoliella spurrieriana]UQS86750.1 5-(carboxyamino)imidazole ribonucleotide synthase [Nicoliella spurrieriana]